MLSTNLVITPQEIKKQESDMETIESMVDRLGITEVMLLLTHICGEKAEHIRENWQDQELAKRWDSVTDALISKRLSNALNKLPK